MSKPEWGHKRICTSCSNPYYDMCRTPVVCPKCHAEFDQVAQNKVVEAAGKVSSVMDKKFSSGIDFGHDSDDDFQFDDVPAKVSDLLDDADEYYTTNDVSDLFKENNGGKYE